MTIQTKLIPIGTLRRSGLKNTGVKFIVCHDTGNDSSTAEGNVNYYINSANEMSASAHAFVDDKGVIECIPLDEKAWHVRYGQPQDNELFGLDSNDAALGVELCYTTKGNFDSKKAYENYVEYIVSLLKKYSLNETKLVGHHRLDPGRRTDPINAFSKIGKTWEAFILDVKSKLAPIDKVEIGRQIKALTDILVNN